MSIKKILLVIRQTLLDVGMAGAIWIGWVLVVASKTWMFVVPIALLLNILIQWMEDDQSKGEQWKRDLLEVLS